MNSGLVHKREERDNSMPKKYTHTQTHTNERGGARVEYSNMYDLNVWLYGSEFLRTQCVFKRCAVFK